jgi:hypothetical protein
MLLFASHVMVIGTNPSIVRHRVKQPSSHISSSSLTLPTPPVFEFSKKQSDQHVASDQIGMDRHRAPIPLFFSSDASVNLDNTGISHVRIEMMLHHQMSQ